MDNKYRIDNQMQSVMKYNSKHKGYIFLAGFFEIDITSDMSEAEQVEKIEKIEAWEDQDEY